MALPNPIDFKKWINNNRHLLKPPVGNKCMFNEDYIVMVVGGPNSRKDFHYNETPEFFFQVEGTMVLKIIEDGKVRDIPIHADEMFYLPPKVPHSPQRPANTVGIVVEYKREYDMRDALQWYCESCGDKLYEEDFTLENIETDLQKIFTKFYPNVDLRTCNSCGSVMAPPV